jgi:hypothetical protein
MEATCATETSIHFQWTRRRYIPEDRTLYNFHNWMKIHFPFNKEGHTIFLMLWRIKRFFRPLVCLSALFMINQHFYHIYLWCADKSPPKLVHATILFLLGYSHTHKMFFLSHSHHHSYCHVIEWLIAFIEHLQIITTSNYSDISLIHTHCSSLQYVLSLFSLLCLHWSWPGDRSNNALCFRAHFKSKSHCDWRSVSKSWCRAPSGWLDIYYCLTVNGLFFVGRPLWREDGSVFCICCWSLSAQSLSGPSPLAGSRWRYSTPPPHGFVLTFLLAGDCLTWHGLHRKHLPVSVSIVVFTFVGMPTWSLLSHCLVDS